MLWSSNDVTQQGSRPKTKLGGRILSHYHGMSCTRRPLLGEKSGDELKANPEKHADLGKEKGGT